MAGDKDSKTELPTEKKRQDAFKKGNFARSPEINLVFVLFSAFSIFLFYSHSVATQLGNAAVKIFAKLGQYSLDHDRATHFLTGKFQEVLQMASPLLIACPIAAIVAGGLQSNFKLTLGVLEPKGDKLNPVKGFQRVFSKQLFTQFGIDFLKFSVVGAVIWGALEQIQNHPIFFAPVDKRFIPEFILDTFLALLIRLITALSVVAALAYLWQRRKTTNDLKMTKEEIKEEFKSQEGDPKTKSARRSLAHRLLQRQMLEEVPMADVVVTNPTHFAVALKYETGKDPAPIVLAKGKNMFAKKIKAIAAEHGVPMVENKPVAQILFKVGQVGKTIPSHLYQVVAEILAYVFKTHKYYFHRLKARRRERDTMLA